jgi:hypothetical protein
MVGWFDPGQLVRTAADVIVSAMFAKNADRRVLDALSHPSADPCDYSTRSELWLDYVADTGDGWNSTYAIAQSLAQPTLDVSNKDATHSTKRGEVLVFGGDEVYPVASRDTYERRLLAAYRTALPETAPPHPRVFAVAGNHDWYDSLVSFTRIFCSGGKRWFAGWETHQTRSYFAVKLPKGWWLIGTDVQLESDIDDPQLEYFKGIAKLMAPTDTIILCTAEPFWISEQRYQRFDPFITEHNLEHLESEEIFGKRIAVYLAGDLHHYRRHTNTITGRHKITAGGGGAFLYPTHVDVDEVQELKGVYKYQTSFPAPETSKKLSWNLLRFARINPSFGWATALVYLLFATAIKVDIGQLGVRDLGRVLYLVTSGILNSQIALLWGVLLVFGFLFFTDTHDPRFKRWGGLTHAAAHLLAAFLLGWFGFYAAETWFGRPVNSIGQIAITSTVIVVGGYVVGPTIMGLYLLVSMNRFRRHAGEFSALKCEDYKSWLRMHVAPNGDLRIYAIGIDAVPRAWKGAKPTWEAPSLLVSADAKATLPRLVDFAETKRYEESHLSKESDQSHQVLPPVNIPQTDHQGPGTPSSEISPARPKEELELVRAVRALITEQTGAAPHRPPEKKLDWLTFFFIAVLAVDVSALYRLLSAAAQYEIPSFAWQLIPGFLGVAFVAYMDGLRAWLVSAARHPGFRILVLLLAIVLVAPQMITYHVLVDAHPGILAWVDDEPVSLKPKDRWQTIALRGFADHQLRISEFHDQNRREDTVTLRRWDMMRASATELPLFGRIFKEKPLRLETRSVISLGLPDDRITLLRIRGQLPLLYRSEHADQGWSVGQAAVDTDEIRMTIHGGANSARIKLPPSATPYRISYVFPTCRDTARELSVTWATSDSLELPDCVRVK